MSYTKKPHEPQTQEEGRREGTAGIGAARGHATHHEAWPVTVRTLDGAEAFFMMYLSIYF